ncbi:hypothetical protein AAVH_26563 [Aphelenchoides avenae]|nr:hypothetical protein AAVH_26563 [Aphelenchus avenae]
MGTDATAEKSDTSFEDLELYTQVPPVTQLPAFSPEPTDQNQLLVLVTLQRGKNGPEKKYDLSFGVDEGANMKTLIEKAMNDFGRCEALSRSTIQSGFPGK